MTVYLVSLHAQFHDHAVGQGLIAQARVIGGTHGVAMGSALLGNHLSGLTNVLSEGEIQTLYRNPAFISQLQPVQQLAVRQAFAESFDDAMRICVYVAAVSLVLSLLTWEKHPISIEARKNQLEAAITAGPTKLPTGKDKAQSPSQA